MTLMLCLVKPLSYIFQVFSAEAIKFWPGYKINKSILLHLTKAGFLTSRNIYQGQTLLLILIDFMPIGKLVQ